MAASTRGRTIQMQPSDVLREAGTLESTIRHELLHMLIDSYALPGTPLWFREGLVLYLTAPNASSKTRRKLRRFEELGEVAAGSGKRRRVTARLRRRPCAGGATGAAAWQSSIARLGAERIAGQPSGEWGSAPGRAMNLRTVSLTGNYRSCQDPLRIELAKKLSHKSVCIRARLQPCRKWPVTHWALAPEVLRFRPPRYL